MTLPRPSTARRHRSPRLLAALALLSLAFSTACNEYPQSTFLLQSDFAWDIQNLFNIILIGAAFVFVTVQAALFYAAIRFRRRPGDPLPKQVHGSTKLEIIWTAAPAVVLAFILVPSTATIFETQAAAPANSLQVQVIGRQFWWEFYYPEFNIRTANEPHMVVGRPVNFILNSGDVIHSFWIPAMGGKRDVVPNHTNYIWWTPEGAGRFPGQCAELCGASHANMRLLAFSHPTVESFAQWVRLQQQPALVPPPGTVAAAGAQVFQQRGCAGCHTIAGTAAQGRTAPDLTHFGSRSTIAAAILDNTPENLRAWIKNPPAIKPGVLMPNLGLSDEELDALVAYLLFLQ